MSLIGKPVKIPTFSLKGISPLYICTDTTIAAKIVYTLIRSRIYNRVTSAIEVEVDSKVHNAIPATDGIEELLWT